MPLLELGPHGGRFAQRYGDRGVGAPVAQPDPAGQLDPSLRDALIAQLVGGGVRQFVGEPQYRFHLLLRQGPFDRLLAQDGGVGQTDAEGGQHPGHRRDEDGADAQCLGHGAGDLAARAAEGGQGVAGDVVTSLDGDALDRVGDVAHRDPQEALGRLLGGQVADPFGEFDESAPRQPGVERLVALRAEDLREVLGLDAAEQQVGVGDGQRPAAAVAGRSGVGAGRVRTDAQAFAVEAQHRAATRRDGVDGQHRCPQPYPGDLGGDHPLVRAREV